MGVERQRSCDGVGVGPDIGGGGRWEDITLGGSIILSGVVSFDVALTLARRPPRLFPHWTVHALRLGEGWDVWLLDVW